MIKVQNLMANKYTIKLFDNNLIISRELILTT